MTKHSQTFGVDVPNDFPIELLEAVHERASKAIYEPQPDLWSEWAGGCNGTIYRFMGAATASDEWVATYTDRPDIDLNVRQDQLLFEFHANALSSVECLAYGLCTIGEFLRPNAFPVTTDPRSITFAFAAKAFGQEFSGDALAQQLGAAHTSQEMEDLRDTRNILTHRSAPGRTFSETLTTTPSGGSAFPGPTTWLNQTLEPQTVQAPREWVARTLTDILEAARRLVESEL